MINDEVSMVGADGVIVSIEGGYRVDGKKAGSRV